MEKEKTYDIICIGGGTGGIACARRSSSYGKKAVVIECSALGGTCINRGCYPMRLIDATADFYSSIDLAKTFFINVGGTGPKSIDWKKYKEKFGQCVQKQRESYLEKCKKEGVDLVYGKAKFIDKNHVEVIENETQNKLIFKSENIVICTGSKPKPASEIKGGELTKTSEDFFLMTEMPKSAIVIGADFVGVGIAAAMREFGVNVTLVTMEEQIVKYFDKEIAEAEMDIMKKKGIELLLQTKATSIEKTKENLFKVSFDKHPPIEAELVFRSVGRMPNFENLDFEKVGLKLNAKGAIETDEFDDTNIQGIYAIGDANGKLPLTPVGIMAAKYLAARLFSEDKFAKMNYSYEYVPTAVYGHPSMCKCGMTEHDAIQKYGKDKIKCYKKTFYQLNYAMSEEKIPCVYKLVCLLPDEKVLGMHGLGKYIEEVIQGFSVAMRKGIVKEDLDNSVPIHITSGEEFLTMQ